MAQPDITSTHGSLSASKVALALFGAAPALYGFRKKGGILAKVATSVGFSLIARSLGASSITGLAGGWMGLPDRLRKPALAA